MQEVVDWREKNINFGSCNYYYQGSPNSPVRRARLSRSEGRASQRQRRNSHNEMQPPRSVSVRRKKRFMKTRKKSLENKEKPLQSIMPHSRESRSVGGTPVCMRKNLTVQNRR